MGAINCCTSRTHRQTYCNESHLAHNIIIILQLLLLLVVVALLLLLLYRTTIIIMMIKTEIH